MKTVVLYCCPACQYRTKYKNDMRRHFYEAKTCVNLTGVVLNDDLKKHIIDNRIMAGFITQNANANIHSENTTKEPKTKAHGEMNELKVANQTLQEHVHLLRGEINEIKQHLNISPVPQYKEIFYQQILEKHLGGNHLQLHTGITDVTTDLIHAEIKIWYDYRKGISQLQLYNAASRRERLQLYFFGNSLRNERAIVCEYVPAFNIELYEFVHEGLILKIVNLITNECIATFPLPNTEQEGKARKKEKTPT